MDNQQVPNVNNQMSGNPQPVSNQETTSTGSIVATIIVIAILILGGLYFWGKRIETQRYNERVMSEMRNTENQANVEASMIRSVDNNDDLDAILNDINNTNVGSVDSNI
jgi:uncharacterized protein HemX